MGANVGIAMAVGGLKKHMMTFAPIALDQARFLELASVSYAMVRVGLNALTVMELAMPNAASVTERERPHVRTVMEQAKRIVRHVTMTKRVKRARAAGKNIVCDVRELGILIAQSARKTMMQNGVVLGG